MPTMFAGEFAHEVSCSQHYILKQYCDAEFVRERRPGPPLWKVPNKALSLALSRSLSLSLAFSSARARSLSLSQSRDLASLLTGGVSNQSPTVFVGEFVHGKEVSSQEPTLSAAR